MQRVNNLWPQVISLENLYHAAYRVLRGKRNQIRAGDFFLTLEHNWLQLQRELRTRTYLPGRYRTFWITTPKQRMISAAPSSETLTAAIRRGEDHVE